MICKLKCYVKINDSQTAYEEEIEVEVQEGIQTTFEIQEAKEDAVKEWMFDNIEFGFSDVALINTEPKTNYSIKTK